MSTQANSRTRSRAAHGRLGRMSHVSGELVDRTQPRPKTRAHCSLGLCALLPLMAVLMITSAGCGNCTCVGESKGKKSSSSLGGLPYDRPNSSGGETASGTSTKQGDQPKGGANESDQFDLEGVEIFHQDKTKEGTTEDCPSTFISVRPTGR